MELLIHHTSPVLSPGFVPVRPKSFVDQNPGSSANFTDGVSVLYQ